MRKLVMSGVSAMAIAGTTLAVAAAPASASAARPAPARPAHARPAPTRPAPHRPAPTKVVASTRITGRPDSGGNGNWATDAMTRTLTIRHLKGQNYVATLADTRGTFVTGRGDFVPNQAADPGVKFTQRIGGTFSGAASFSFTASRTPNANLVPRRATGSGPTDTSDWYKLAFPAGTVFGGTGILNNWGWSYTTSQGCRTVSRHHRTTVQPQTWKDFASDNSGQGPGRPAAGQIADFPRNCRLSSVR
jgi:hypothetical protein